MGNDLVTINRREMVRLRVIAGLSVARAADLVGCSAAHLGYIEAGQRNPSERMLNDIAAAYGVPTETLFTVSGAA